MARRDDLLVLREALQGVEGRARSLPWAEERPWHASTHVGREGVPTVDLHDLDVPTAKDAVRAVIGAAEGLDTGAVVIVTGVGRHSMGKGGALAQAVRGLLRDVCAEEGWELRPLRPGALVVVWDPSRTPPELRGGLGVLFWVVALAFLAALVWALVTGG